MNEPVKKTLSGGGGGAGAVFNQQILTANGAIDARLQQLSKKEHADFIAKNQHFFNGFGWIYYQDWRKTRAESLAYCLDIYKMLNVKMELADVRGETFYAGIPEATPDEVNAALKSESVRAKYGIKKENWCDEKIGIDGKTHKTDEYSCFPDILDENDIYCDKTMVSLKEYENRHN
jgi:hypothetical protein